MSDNTHLDDFFGLGSPINGNGGHEKLGETISKRVGIWVRIRLLAKVLTRKERYLIMALLLIAAGSILALPIAAYYLYTEPVPAYGGSFSEGVIGEPRHINPLLAQANNADMDMVNLIYSSILKYDKDGKLIPDLAKSYEISSDGLNYTIYLRDDAKWSDGKPVTADDVVFTIKTAQNSDFGSNLRVNWLGVDAEAVDNSTVIIKLKDKYAQFLNNLTVGILPKHIWENIKPINFALSELNIKPVGSGPYRISKLKKDANGALQSYELSANKNFYGGRPYIDGVIVKFYPTEDDLISAYENNEIDGMGTISPTNLVKLRFQGALNIRPITMPRYFAAFFNQTQSKVLANKNVRLALSYATDKKALLDGVLDGHGQIAHSPLADFTGNLGANVRVFEYNPSEAQKVLDADGWEMKDGARVKSGEKLSLQITTSSLPELVAIANILKEQWETVGVDITLQILPAPSLQQAIRERNYQVLVFGEVLSFDPDPFIFWHSSQKKDPGLNLALYDNKATDTILEEARKVLNPLERAQKYDDFRKIVAEDIPTIFLYTPYYIYPQSKKIKGFEANIMPLPSDRFDTITEWYIKTERQKKQPVKEETN